MVDRSVSAPSNPSRGRLDVALADYLASLEIDDLSDVSIEAVAQVAGVSRATAYRYFRDRETLLFQAAITLARQHVDRCIADLAEVATVAGKMEESFVYVSREIRTDWTLQLLMTSPRAKAIDDAVRAMSAEVIEPVIREGQSDGQVRTDVSADEIIGWLVEQQYVMTRLALDEDAARAWFRRFVLPALRVQTADDAFTSEMDVALADMQKKVEALRDAVEQARLSLP